MTDLSQQLRRLAGLKSSQPNQSDKFVPSILFNSKEARTIDYESILQIAESGILELIKIDERFRPFKVIFFFLYHSFIHLFFNSLSLLTSLVCEFI